MTSLSTGIKKVEGASYTPGNVAYLWQIKNNIQITRNDRMSFICPNVKIKVSSKVANYHAISDKVQQKNLHDETSAKNTHTQRGH